MRALHLPVRSLMGATAVSVAGGCALALSGGAPIAPPLRAAIDAPVRFEVVDPSLRVSPADTIAGEGCRSPLVDPRDRTQLRMVRAGGDGTGDYEVPEGRYGVGRGEVLRVDCNTGQALGIARRQRNNP